MYGNRIERVVPYGYETISGWRNAGNMDWYMRTNETFQCLCAGEEARKIGGLAQEKEESCHTLLQLPFTSAAQCKNFLRNPL
tara:strand:+ start:834 stop:1079 length:246 start_codon:yes stop_codon:yes gene_type:complete